MRQIWVWDNKKCEGGNGCVGVGAKSVRVGVEEEYWDGVEERSVTIKCCGLSQGIQV